VVRIPVKITVWFAVRGATTVASHWNVNIMTTVRKFGPQIIEDNLEFLMQNWNLELDEAAREMLTVSNVKQWLFNTVRNKMGNGRLGRAGAFVVIPIFKKVLWLMHPFVTITLEAFQKWIEVNGKRYLESIAPEMSVREAIDLLAQVFPEDFSDIKRRFDEGAQTMALLQRKPPEARNMDAEVNATHRMDIAI